MVNLYSQNKEFVYRGDECEKLPSFQQRQQSQFSGATILGSNSPPTEEIKSGDELRILFILLKILKKRYFQTNIVRTYMR